MISAQRRDMVGATIYLVGRDARSGELLHDATSCPMCRRMIINAGIRRVVYEQGYPDDFSLQLFHDAQIPIEQYDPATGGTTPC